MAETLVSEEQGLESTTVKIYRTATVVKGGRRFSFGALVVVGDRKGSVGIGYGKAPGVPGAIEKAQKQARKSMVHMTLQEGTLPHQITSKYGASLIKLVPAAPGTGVIAGATVRAVLDLVGVRDCLTKSFGSNNHKNLLKATIEGLRQLRLKEEIADLRGVQVEMTDVEKRLEAGRRYAPTVVAPTPEGPQVQAGGKRGKPKGPGRGKGPKAGGPAAAPDAAVTTAPAPSEPPAQSAAAGTEPPAATDASSRIAAASSEPNAKQE